MVIQMVVCRLVMEQMVMVVVQMIMTGDDGNSESIDDQFIPITVEEVSKLFSKCKVGKACGPDNSMYLFRTYQLSAPFPRMQNLNAAMLLDR